MRALCLLALIAVSGCSSHELATPKGPYFALNPDGWQWTQVDLQPPLEASK